MTGQDADRARRGVNILNIAAKFAPEVVYLRLAELEEGLRRCDELASVAHDAIWAEEVQPCSRLHDNDDMLSAQSAIWQLHNIARALLAEGKGAA